MSTWTQIPRMLSRLHLHGIMGIRNIKKRVDTLYIVSNLKKKTKLLI